MKKELFEYGIVNIDKPVGPTSHTVCEYVRKILETEKAGHGGTLDPKVGGVLLIGLNKATRMLELLLALPKTYVGVMHLHEDIPLTKIRNVIKKKFLGKIKQLPPKKSAVKREERTREIYEFKLLEKKGKDVLFRVSSQAGTYIRKLISDLGDSIKTGAHMLELRRVAVGNFSERKSVTLYELTEAYEAFKQGKPAKLNKLILPIEKVAEHLPKAIVRKKAADKLQHGNFLSANEFILSGKAQKGQFVAIFYKKKLVSLGRMLVEQKELSKLKKQKRDKWVLRPEKVFVR